MRTNRPNLQTKAHSGSAKYSLLIGLSLAVLAGGAVHPEFAMASKSNELLVYVDALPLRVDGHFTDSYAQWTLVYNLADRVVEYGDKGHLVTNLATSYSIKNGGSEYNFEVAKGRKFHDGSEVTVDDIVYSLQEAAKIEKSASGIEKTLVCEGAGQGCGVEKTGSHSFKVTLKGVDPGFLEKLNMNELAIRSRRAATEGRLVYSGPYSLKKDSEASLLLEAQAGHPSLTSSSFSKVRALPFPSDQKEIADAVRSKNAVFISKKISSMKLGHIPHEAGYTYAAGTSLILYLNPTLANKEFVRTIISARGF